MAEEEEAATAAWVVAVGCRGTRGSRGSRTGSCAARSGGRRSGSRSRGRTSGCCCWGLGAAGRPWRARVRPCPCPCPCPCSCCPSGRGGGAAPSGNVNSKFLTRGAHYRMAETSTPRPTPPVTSFGGLPSAATARSKLAPASPPRTPSPHAPSRSLPPPSPWPPPRAPWPPPPSPPPRSLRSSAVPRSRGRRPPFLWSSVRGGCRSVEGGDVDVRSSPWRRKEKDAWRMPVATCGLIKGGT